MALGHDLSADERLTLQTIFWSAGASRHALAHRLGFSKSKTNNTVSSLLDVGLLDEVGLQGSSGGRRAETVKLSSTLGVIFGADLGATSLDLVLMLPDLTIVAHHSEPADVRSGPGIVLARLRVLMRQLLKEGGFTAKQVIGIGIGVPGPGVPGGQWVGRRCGPHWCGRRRAALPLRQPGLRGSHGRRSRYCPHGNGCRYQWRARASWPPAWKPMAPSPRRT